MPLISRYENGNGTRKLTLTRVRTTITDSKIAFAGVNSTILLNAVRTFISALSVAVVVEWCVTFVDMSPTAQGSGVVMAQCSGRRGTKHETVDSWIVGREAHAWPAMHYPSTAHPKYHPHGGLTQKWSSVDRPNAGQKQRVQVGCKSRSLWIR